MSESDTTPGSNLAAHQGQRLVRVHVDKSAGFLLRHAARLFDTALQTSLQPKGTAAGQYPILLFLWEKDGQSETELGEKAKISAPTLVRTLDRMVEAGLVRRKVNPEDRRGVRILLTAKARTLQAELLTIGIEAEERALEGLDAETRKSLVASLQRVIQNLDVPPRRWRRTGR